MQTTLNLIGWLVIIIGIIAAIVVVNSLTIEVPYYTIPGTHTEPSPYRWYASIGIVLSTFIPGIFFLSIAKIINLLSKIQSSLRQS